MSSRVALPSRGRLREACLGLLERSGYSVSTFQGAGSRALAGNLELIEMRPRDAAAWLHAGRLAAAFVSTDIALDEGIDDWPTTPLGFARSDLVVAARQDAGITSVADLAGGTVATHLPGATRTWLEARGIDASVVAMGGALEGVCAAGLADAIVDLRETGASLAQNRLTVLEVIRSCEAALVAHPDATAELADLTLRLEAALAARRTQYVVLHLPPSHLDELRGLFPGLASPTVVPLAGREDLVAAHFVVERAELWARLGQLRALGASGIVALPTEAIVS